MSQYRSTRCLIVMSLVVTTMLQPMVELFAQNPRRRIVAGRTSVEELARMIDHLESHVEDYGSVVMKAPDVWGEERLTLHRFEFEQQLRAELGNFRGTLNAQIARSDQAFLASALAVSSAIGPGGSAPTTNRAVGLLSGSVETTNIVPTADGINRTSSSSSPFASVLADPRTSDGKSVALEPTLFLDQLSRYIYHLHELRRINEGDDLKDLPGYTLHLLRMPVSILPGKKTRQGFGAQLTVTATPQLGDELLPLTFKDWVQNDLAYQIGLAMFDMLNDPSVCEKTPIAKAGSAKADKSSDVPKARKSDNTPSKSVRITIEILKQMLATIGDADADGKPLYSLADNGWWVPERSYKKEQFLKGLDKRIQNLPWLTEEQKVELANLKNEKIAASLGLEQTEWISQLVPFVNFGGKKDADKGQTPKGKAPKEKAPSTPGDNPPSTPEDNNFRDALWNIVQSAGIKLGSNPSRNAQMAFPLSHFSTVYGQGMLLCVGLDAFERIGRDRDTDLVQYQEVEGYLREEIAAAYELLQRPENQMLWSYATPELASAIRRRDRKAIEAIRIEFFNQLEFNFRMPQHDGGEAPTGCFAWAILVNATLLNERLNEDLKAVTSTKGCACLSADWQQFHLPDPSAEARMIFNQYVQCRWPIHTFHLDPQTADQNVGDKFSSTRDLQLAMAVALSTGSINVDQATKFSRRLQLDLETIALNRTCVGFSHGEETFGWRFYPRVQSPPIESNFTVICRDMLRGGPSNDALLKLRQIEPGQRECVALVVAPAFLRQLILDVNGDWQGLTNSRKGKPTTETGVRLGREVQCIREVATACQTDSHLHRDGEVHRLLQRARQLEQMLPLQTIRAEVPVMNDLGGFRLLIPSGNVNKSPQLYGWSGRPGYIRGRRATFFLLGENFKLQGMRVTAGTKLLTPNHPASATPNSSAKSAASTEKPAADKAAATSDQSTASADKTKVAKSSDDTGEAADGTSEPAVRIISDSILEITVPEDCQTFTKLKPDGEPGQFISVQVASYFGVSQKLHIPLSADTIEDAAAKVVSDASNAATEAVKKAITTHEALRHVNRYDWETTKMTGIIKFSAANAIDRFTAEKSIVVAEQTKLTPFYAKKATLRGFVYQITKDADGKEVRKQLMMPDGNDRPVATEGLAIDFAETGVAAAGGIAGQLLKVIQPLITKSDQVVAIELEGFLKFTGDEFILKLEQPLRFDLKEEESQMPKGAAGKGAKVQKTKTPFDAADKPSDGTKTEIPPKPAEPAIGEGALKGTNARSGRARIVSVASPE